MGFFGIAEILASAVSHVRNCRFLGADNDFTLGAIQVLFNAIGVGCQISQKKCYES